MVNKYGVWKYDKDIENNHDNTATAEQAAIEIKYLVLN